MIRVESLSKDYGPVRALDSVSFEVGKNQILGFLGPNGAGKSTAMKIITTYLAPTGGRVTVDGIDVVADPIAVRRSIGYLPESNPLYVDMRVDDYLRFCGKSRGLDGVELQRRLGFVVEVTGLGRVLKKEIHELSKGFKQRTGLAQALIHDPAILILDEPTTGLDPLQIIEIRRLIQELAREKTIIFSTHILQEVSSTTDRVVIINRGKIIADGSVSELQHEHRDGRPVRASFVSNRQEVEEQLAQVVGLRECRVLGESDGVVSVSLRGDGGDFSRRVAEVARDRQWTVLELAHSESTLEDIFIQLVQKSSHQSGEVTAHA